MVDEAVDEVVEETEVVFEVAVEEGEVVDEEVMAEAKMFEFSSMCLELLQLIWNLKLTFVEETRMVLHQLQIRSLYPWKTST